MDLARPGLSMKLRVRFKVTISTMVTTLTLGVTVEAPRSSTDPVAGRSFRFDSDETLIGPDGAVYDVFYPSHDEKARENLFFIVYSSQEETSTTCSDCAGGPRRVEFKFMSRRRQSCAYV